MVSLLSRPFTTPGTGRLAISVWLRVANPAQQPPLRLALEGNLHGRVFYRCAQVGQAPAGGPAVPIFPQWGRYVSQVDDLPLEGLTSLRVRFDLMGPGEVWIDDIQLYHLLFSRAEMVELSKLITLADVKLQSRQIGDCLQLLDGYWPQFLEENVPLPPTPPSETAKDRPPEEKPPERTGWFDRMKEWLPKSVRF